MEPKEHQQTLCALRAAEIKIAAEKYVRASMVAALHPAQDDTFWTRRELFDLIDEACGVTHV